MKDEHGLEIAHGLRYAAGNIVAYAVHVCVGPEKALKILPEVWKAIFAERFEDYKSEVLKWTIDAAFSIAKCHLAIWMPLKKKVAG